VGFRLRRAIVSVLLVLGMGAATAGHRDTVDAPAPGGQLEAHHHGPHARCPEGVETQCLACASHSLFAPAPSPGRLEVPVSVRVEGATAEGRDRNAERPDRCGRSPPAVLPIA
jgi:hypothetical protein